MNTKIQLLSVSVSIIVSSIIHTVHAGDKIVFPIQEMSKLECRFQDFDTLSSSCKMTLPELKTKDYTKYATQNNGYNDFTRIYTVLWGASYTYGWDQGNGGHQGVDIATAKGTPVYAMADGKVIIASTNIGWGKVISVEHSIDGKTLVSDYAHLSKILVNPGDTVQAGQKIGEVGSTGNSTGNHLHFQIDLKSPFYPYYYDYAACPYSYNEIINKGLCFDELASHTIDPILFFETNGAILEHVKETVSTTKKSTNTTNSNTTTTSNGNIDSEIFYTYVYKDSSSADIKEVQYLYKLIGAYNGALTGDYDDIEESIIAYQISSGVIPNRDADGAGYFGPKTRAQTKIDYEAYVARGGKVMTALAEVTNTSSDSNEPEQISTIKTQKISRVGLLSREEIEKKEVEDFLKIYKINLKNTGNLDSVTIGKNSTILLQVQDKKGKAFRGSTPGNISFSIDSSIATAFPTEFFYFDDSGERQVHIKGVKQGTTTLSIKLGDVVLQTLTVRVGTQAAIQEQKDLGVQAGVLLANASTVVGEAKTGIVLLRDAYGKAIFQKNFEGQFAINASQDVQFCIKKGDLKDIKTIYHRNCKETEYQDTLVYDYDDTVAGLLIFDYKVFERNTRLELVKLDETRTLSARNVTVKNPTGLKANYEYYDEVLSTLEKGITTGVTKGYFLEDRRLTEYDATIWIRNALTVIKNDTQNTQTRGDISKKILLVSDNLGNPSKYISREEFLDLATEYMTLDQNMIGNITVDYLDLDDQEDAKANIFFNQNITWRDQFGENYFRPNEKITRGEGAYFISKVIYANQKMFLASR